MQIGLFLGSLKLSPVLKWWQGFTLICYYWIHILLQTLTVREPSNSSQNHWITGRSRNLCQQFCVRKIAIRSVLADTWSGVGIGHEKVVLIPDGRSYRYQLGVSLWHICLHCKILISFTNWGVNRGSLTSVNSLCKQVGIAEQGTL